jgi:NADPH:quinone reductase-like Zn-dependent oxidoreductase
MQAFLYDKTHPNKLVLQEVPKPVPGAKEVLVKIRTLSLNAADYRSLAMGLIPKSKILGSGIAGTIEAVGKDVQAFRIGDHVVGDLADSGFGGCAEYALAHPKALVHKPDTLAFDLAATLPVAATTALQALRNIAPVQSGQQVLILGSSGGVGTFAVQLAKHFGATVTGVCSTRNLAQTKSMGADHVIDYTQADVTSSDTRYDLILAINGQYPLGACKRLLKPKGTYVMVGGSLTQIFKALILGRFYSFGSKKIRTLAAKANQVDLDFVAELAASGQLKPLIEKRYVFADTALGMQYLSEGHAIGKIVINVQ